MTNSERPRVVVGFDGSPASQRALEWAADYVRATGGTLDAVVAWHYEPAPVGPGLIPPPPYDAEDAARKLLSHAVAILPDPPRSLRQVVVQGAAAPTLLDQARDADLLVVGNRGRGGFAGLLLGSVSIQCVHHAPCAVVVIRSPQ